MTTSTIAATFWSTRGRAVPSPKFGRAGVLLIGTCSGPSTFSLRHGLAATIEQNAHTPRAHAASTPPRRAVNPRGRAACST